MPEEEKYPAHYNRTLNPLYWCGATIGELGALTWRLLIQAPFLGLSHGIRKHDDLGKIKIGVGMIVTLQIIVIILITR